MEASTRLSKYSRVKSALYIGFLSILVISSVSGKLHSSQADSEIELSVEKNGSRVEFSVVDKRGDISSVEVFKNDRLFYRFYQRQETKPENGIVTFVFDDGWLDIYTKAYPIFAKHNYPASVAVISNYVDKPGALSSRHLHKLVGVGWDLLTHSTDDRALTELNQADQRKALTVSQAFMWQNYWASEIFVYPFGAYDQGIIDTTERFYLAARGYNNGLNTIPIDPFDIQILSLENNTTLGELTNRIYEAKINKSALVIVGHHTGRSSEGLFAIEPELLSQTLDYISTQNIPVVTLGQLIHQYATTNDKHIDANTLYWEFDDYLLKDGSHDFYVVVDGRRSNTDTIEI